MRASLLHHVGGWIARLVSVAMFATMGATARAGDHVSIWLDKADDSVHVAYHFAPGTVVRFTGDEDWQRAVRQDWWKRDPDCFKLEGNGVRLGTAKRCSSASIRLDWDDRVRSRTYPALVRMANGGVLVYAGYVGVLGTDGKAPAEIRLQAPANGVASFRDRKSEREIVLGPPELGDDVNGWFYLGPDRFTEESAARVLTDDRVPAELRRVVVEISPRLMRLYAERLGAPYPRRPTFFLTWTARQRPGRSFQADVVPGGDVRFALTGAGWSSAGPTDLANFEFVAAHELAHLWNIDVFNRPEWTSAWLHEGNSELLATAALLALGEISADEATDRITAAALGCDTLARGRPWKDVAERERDPFPNSCGLAMQFAIVTAAHRRSPGLDAFGYWRGLWTTHPTYYEAVFEQDAVARGDEALSSLLRDAFTGSLPVGNALRRLLALGGLDVHAHQRLGPLSRSWASRRIMSNVMRLDCHGQANFAGFEDHFEVVDNGAVRRCGALQDGMRVVAVEGLDVMKAPVEIARRLEAACAHDEPITVGLNDSKSVQIACSAQSQQQVAFDPITLDPAPVAKTLDASPRR